MNHSPARKACCNGRGGDPTFQVGAGFNRDVRCLLLQPDGKLVVGGSFTTYQGQAAPYLVRLTPNGDLDTDFTPALAGTASVVALALQADGRILVSGGPQLFRLMPHGTVDPACWTGYHSPHPLGEARRAHRGGRRLLVRATVR